MEYLVKIILEKEFKKEISKCGEDTATNSCLYMCTTIGSAAPSRGLYNGVETDKEHRPRAKLAIHCAAITLFLELTIRLPARFGGRILRFETASSVRRLYHNEPHTSLYRNSHNHRAVEALIVMGDEDSVRSTSSSWSTLFLWMCLFTYYRAR